MDNVKNELTGPRVFVVVADNKKGKIHLTGGYAKPEMNKSMCGAKLGMKNRSRCSGYCSTRRISACAPMVLSLPRHAGFRSIGSESLVFCD